MPTRTSLPQRVRYRLARWLMPDIYELLLHRAAELDSAADQTTAAEYGSEEPGVPKYFQFLRPGPPEHWLKLVRESAPQLLIDDSEAGLPKMGTKEATKADDALKISAQPVQALPRPIEQNTRQVEKPESSWTLSSRPDRKPSSREWIADVMRSVLSIVSRKKVSSAGLGDVRHPKSIAVPNSVGEGATQSKQTRVPLTRPDKQGSRSPSEPTADGMSFDSPSNRPHEDSERHVAHHAADELASPRQSIREALKPTGIVEGKRQADGTTTKRGSNAAADYRQPRSARLPPQEITKHFSLNSHDVKSTEAPIQRSEAWHDGTKIPMPQTPQDVAVPQMQSADFQPPLQGCLQAPAKASLAVSVDRRASGPTQSTIGRPSNPYSERNRWPQLMKTARMEETSMAAIVAQQRWALLQREQAGGD